MCVWLKIFFTVIGSVFAFCDVFLIIIWLITMFYVLLQLIWCCLSVLDLLFNYFVIDNHVLYHFIVVTDYGVTCILVVVMIIIIIGTIHNNVASIILYFCYSWLTIVYLCLFLFFFDYRITYNVIIIIVNGNTTQLYVMHYYYSTYITHKMHVELSVIWPDWYFG